MTGQDRPPAYPAERAGNVALGMSIAGAIVCITAGYLQLRAGNQGAGWLLIAVGLVPLIGAVIVRLSVRKRKHTD